MIRIIITLFRLEWAASTVDSGNLRSPEDERFLGEPGEIKTTYKNNYRIDTKIGEDGRAVHERHYTDHSSADKHTNPHDQKSTGMLTEGILYRVHRLIIQMAHQNSKIFRR